MLPPDEVVLLDVAVLDVDGLLLVEELLEVEGLLLDVVVLVVLDVDGLLLVAVLLEGLDGVELTVGDGVLEVTPVLPPLSGSCVSLISPEVPVEELPSDTV